MPLFSLFDSGRVSGKNQINFWGNNCRKRFLSWAEWKWEFECSLPPWEFWKSFKKNPNQNKKELTSNSCFCLKCFGLLCFPPETIPTLWLPRLLGQSLSLQNTRTLSDFWELQESGKTVRMPHEAGAIQEVLEGSEGMLLLQLWQVGNPGVLAPWHPFGYHVPLGTALLAGGRLGFEQDPLPRLGSMARAFTRVFASGAVSQEQLSVWALGRYSFHTGHQTWTVHLGPCFKWREYAYRKGGFFFSSLSLSSSKLPHSSSTPA